MKRSAASGFLQPAPRDPLPPLVSHNTTRLTLVRHGRVQNPEKIVYGRLPGFGLSRRGRFEAGCAARALSSEPLAAIYASPLLRAKQTAAAIQAYHPHLKVHTSRLLTEVCGPFEGQSKKVVDALGGDTYTGAVPPCEQPRDIIRRVQQFIYRIRKKFAGRQVAAVTHGDVITFTLLWASALPPTPELKHSLSAVGLSDPYPAMASMSTLVYRTLAVDERPLILYKRADCRP
ncbi:MAG: histidine phosphatase family protein [Desulfobacterales bacterium]